MPGITPQWNTSSTDPMYIQIYRSTRDDILAGRIAPGGKLPSIRNLSERLGVSRTPVALAYEQLLAEGYAISKPRSGLFAVKLDAALAPAASGADRMSAILPSPPRAYHASPSEAARYDFGYGTIDLDSFPYAKWRKLLNLCFLPENNRVLMYGDYQGEPELRTEIGAYLHQSRGIRCTPEQIVIGAGTYHSLDLLFQLLQGEVTALAAEEAVNDGVKALLEQSRFTLHPLRLESDGIRMEDVYESRAQALYVTPSHQFPYGMTLSIGKRTKLLDWANQTGAYLIENDYDGEFRYGGRPIPALQSLDDHGRVIYVGTFSKALTPSLRLSYLILTPELLERFRQKKHSFDQLASPIFQKTLQLFMQSGDFERHVRRMRKVYGGRHHALLTAIRSRFGDKAAVIGAGSGLHLLMKVRNGMSEEKLVRSAKQAGVHVYPTSIYALKPELAPSSTVLLGFGGMNEDDIHVGIERLSRMWL
ncbi:MocR-like pyridoxine biosynthesis transcription factor PdxR [Paenibacillus mendelii]|uniref:PLP-dependent aminotransferase family protein n=1 Tax=Paenibacillus mendelii TaxID=206163 RepID=A0ABV6J9Z3_9BACL|nr:PLP-dependent aminotransferase family protein [Paenibacillus mendelii]MCQ6559633.1 PLP-dependent aminotransferase family protein [Paenibacillus mendelii]